MGASSDCRLDIAHTKNPIVWVFSGRLIKVWIFRRTHMLSGIMGYRPTIGNAVLGQRRIGLAVYFQSVAGKSSHHDSQAIREPLKRGFRPGEPDDPGRLNVKSRASRFLSGTNNLGFAYGDERAAGGFNQATDLFSSGGGGNRYSRRNGLSRRRAGYTVDKGGTPVRLHPDYRWNLVDKPSLFELGKTDVRADY